ncbi:DUF3160 domain-containing protein [Polyangium jinanense]|uniref:DUF3160 domain-containing protein n=1 Tax=Polyangium jinanense TaxID=2829994 RepID=A0A9X3X5H9_9BACT|nr:DUF3160 domain-containing protein [Polyangium jinanense]MDC3956019.1 DUF3160 domain-containing protein [Polyangium jinanense]MDC3982950.1 DUF3160 domain-containing protein [Polyangium jinanense]
MRPRLAALSLATILGAACSPAATDHTGVPAQPTAPASSAVASASASAATSAAPPKAPSPSELIRSLKAETACALPTSTPPTTALADLKLFTPVEPRCGGFDCDFVEKTPKGEDACFISNEAIRRVEPKARAGGAAQKPASAPWDGVKKPRFLDRIDAHVHLTDVEHARLRENGFVALDRLPYLDYANAFHDVFQEELPLYVGPDPILHAVFRATELSLARIERTRLQPALESMLKKLRKALAASGASIDETTRKDLDLYLALAAAHVPQKTNTPLSLFGQDNQVEALLSAERDRKLTPVELFGRTRMIDFTQFEPRGHYADNTFFDQVKMEVWQSDAYFAAIMWLSRLEWNLVSRDSRSSHPDATPDPRETPREARAALALAELAQKSGALAEIGLFEEIYGAFAGRREDVGVPDLLRLMQKGGFTAKDPAAPEKLRLVIGDGFRRTARVHFMPQGVTNLPVISTLLGMRIVPDIAPLGRLVHDDVQGRSEIGAADVAYLLGHDRAATYLKNDLDRFPDLRPALDTARAELATGAAKGRDVQASFLRAILALRKDPEGARPSFMAKDAYADLRLGSALVGYAQLRHTFVLIAGQGYDAYGCAIPDAYVEPLVPFYDALIAHVENLRKVASGGFDGLLRVLGTLRAIARTELARGAPTPDQATWLAMVAEHIPLGGYGGDSGEPPKWTGWYFDMFEDREIGATRAADLVADYFTLTSANQVAYLGADGPRLGVFVVDTGGEPRAMVGPVARGYEIHAPLEKRLDDQTARTHLDKRAPWRESFATAPVPDPSIGLAGNVHACARDGKLEARLVLASDRDLGPVAVTLLDHHGDPLVPALTQDVGAGFSVYSFRFPEIPWPPPEPTQGQRRASRPRSRASSPVEAIVVRIEDLARAGAGRGAFTRVTSPSVFSGKDYTPDLPTRPRGTFFSLGER